MFWKHLRKNNLEVIFKRNKRVFFENDGVQEEIYEGAEWPKI